MRADTRLPEKLEKALKKDVLKRLPLTFLPYVNQQINEWDFLFPNERKAAEALVVYVDGLTAEQSERLFHDVVEIEGKMGVRNWKFSTTEQTIQNSSQLASSPWFQDWRRAVQAVFDAADEHARKTSGASEALRNRLVLLDIPRNIPVSEASVWRRWRATGEVHAVGLPALDLGQGVMEYLLTGPTGPAQNSVPNAVSNTGAGLLDTMRTRRDASLADVWVVDAEKRLVESILALDSAREQAGGSILLSYARLDSYRQSFAREMNTMRKDLSDADAVFDRLRKVEVTQWCPREALLDPVIPEFVRSLYLSGNGAVIFGNSFVEWAASEAFRRARPALLAAQFGIRSKPKPFTGVAVFENPDQVNPLPTADDLPGSATDAEILALYVWLAACRYDEYQQTTVCVCLAESLGKAYVVAPREFNALLSGEPLSAPRLRGALCDWMA
jgi:hypothetical protein